MLGEKQDKWDINVSRIAAILRSDYHNAIKCSPYFCIFGSTMIRHGSAYPIMKKLGGINHSQLEVVPNDSKMELLHEKIKDNLIKAHEKATKSYNLRSRNVQFKVGQVIFRKNFQQSDFKKGINAKLLPPFVKCKVRKKNWIFLL